MWVRQERNILCMSVSCTCDICRGAMIGGAAQLDLNAQLQHCIPLAFIVWVVPGGM